MNQPTANPKAEATVADVLQAHASQRGNKVACVFTDGEREWERLSYAELDRRARLRAGGLQERLPRGSRVLILLPHTAEYIEILLGCFYAGMVAVPSFPPRRGRDRERIQRLIRDAEPELAVAAEGAYLEDLPMAISPEHLQGAWTPIEHAGKDLAFLQYTSGSTSEPRGVMITHGNLIANERAIQRAFSVSPESIVASWLPFFHDMGLVGTLLQPLFTGATAVFMPPVSFAQEPLRWLRTIDRYRATISGGPNFGFERCIEQASEHEVSALDLSCWKTAFTGAEPVRAATLGRFNQKFRQFGFSETAWLPCYGLAESTLLVAAGRSAATGGGDAVSCGLPADGTEIVIADPERRQPCTAGEVGEIWVSSPSVAQGYWNRPEESARTFQASLAADPHRRYLRTGDLGTLVEDGLRIVGRIKDQFIRGGRNYYAKDLEFAAEEAHPAILAGGVAAFALDDEDAVAMALEIPRHTAFTPQEVATAVRAALLAEFEWAPALLVLTPPLALPRTSSGKLRRSECRRQLLAGELKLLARFASEDLLEQGRTLPRAASTLEWLRLALAATLRVQPAAISDETSLSALGLGSMQIVALLYRMETELGVALPLSGALAARSLVDLARQVEHAVPGTEAAERTDTLSMGQMSLYLEQKLHPKAASCNLSGVVSVAGSLDLDRWRSAWAAVARQTPALRAAVHEANGIPRFQYDEHLSPLVTWVDATDWTEARLQSELRSLAQAVIPMETTPLWGIHIFRRSTEAHTVLLRFHHLLVDLWSISLLWKRFVAAYEGAPSASADPESKGIGARLFSVESRATSNKEISESQEKERRVASPQIAIRTGAAQSFRGKRLLLRLPLASRLRQCSAAIGTTPAAFLLAAFQLTLSRYAAQKTFTIGLPYFGRESLHESNEVGYLVRLLPVFADLTSVRTYAQLARAAQDAVLASIATTGRPNGSSFAPDVVFAFQELAGSSEEELLPFLLGFGDAQWSAADMQMRSVDWDPGIAQRDLTCTLGLHGPDLLVAVEYDEARLHEDAVRRLVADFSGLAEAGCDTPERDLAELTLASASVPPVPSPLRVQVSSLAHGFEVQADRAPEAIALVDGARRYTYRELNAKANRLAHRLVALGAAPEQRVAILAERSVRYLIAILAVVKSGAAYAPMDTSSPADRVAAMLDDLQPCLLLTEHAVVRSVSPTVPVLYLDDDEGTEPESNLPLQSSPSNLAYVIFTSGSTGRPKGCMVTHRNVLRLFQATSAQFSFSEEDCWSLFHSFAFDFSVWEMWGAWLSGGRVVLLSHDETRSPETTVAVLRREGVTLFSQTPSAFRQLLTTLGPEVAAELNNLRFVVFGGEALDFAQMSGWFRYAPPQIQLVNMYGITETTVHVTARRVYPEDTGSRRSLIGAPLDDLQTLLLDEDLQPVPVGVPGELYVCGGGVCRGYLNQPALTADRFMPNPYGMPGDRMYRTGDLARRTSDGDLQYLGRNDSQVQMHGYRIELGEIESALSALPSVRQAVVAVRLVAVHQRSTDTGIDAVEDAGQDLEVRVLPFRRYLKQVKRSSAGGFDGDGQPTPRGSAPTETASATTEPQMIAYIVPAEGSDLPQAEIIRKALSRNLPPYMLPHRIVPLTAFPLTPTGKVDRNALPDPGPVERDSAQSLTLPETATEHAICRVWSAVLDQPAIGIDDNYFALGGDSIRGIRCVALAADAGLRFTLPQLYANPTVRELAAALVPSQPEAEEPQQTPFALLALEEKELLPPGLDDAYPMSRMQAGLLFHSEQHAASSVYRASFLYRIEARCDADAFLESVRQVVAHYPILRTSFDLVRFREPMQLVWSQVEPPCSVLDLRQLAPEQQEAEEEAWFRAERLRDFSTDIAPLIRFSMHLLSESEFALGITCHDAILDGWSTASILVHLLQCYGMRLQDEQAILPEQTLTYRDFVLAERETLASPEAKAYWQDRLDGVHVTHLPIWKASAQLDAPSLSVVDVEVPRAMSAVLIRLAGQLGVSLKSVLLAAHLRVLQLLTGSDDVVTGLEANGRPERQGSELTVGQHLNTVPFRMQVSASCWAAFIRELAHVEQEMLPYRRFPYAEIQRMQGGTALYDTTFNYTHFHVFRDLDQTPGVRVVEGHGRELTHYLLKTEFNRDAETGQLNLDVIFDRGRMGEAQADYIGRLYRAVLRAICANPNARMEEVAVPPLPRAWEPLALSAGELVPRPAITLMDLLEQQAIHSPNNIAVRFGMDQLTYAELHRQADCIATALRQAGVGPERIVGMHMDRCLELVVAYLAIWKAGGVALPLAMDAPAERLAAILRSADPLLILTRDWVISHLRDDTPPLPAGSHGCTPANGAYLLYTSGSTGTPKGVLNTHAGLLNRIVWMQDNFGLDATDRVLQKTPVSFDVSVWEFFWPLMSGAILVLASPGGHSDPAYLLDCIERENVTTAHFVPSMLSVFLQAVKPGRLPSLRRTLVSGEALTPAQARAFYETLPGELHNLYGPTEAAIDVTALAVPSEVGRSVSIGKPIANVRAYILDSDLHLSIFGAEGELYLSGPCLARCYMGRPELTAERFLPDPFAASPGERMYRTGDRVRYASNGDIEFLGRTDAQLKVNGVRIEPAEVESALERHPAVRQAAVFGQLDGTGRALLAGCYTVRSGHADPLAELLRSFLLNLLPASMVPSRLIRVETLPIGPTGKLDRAALPRLPFAEAQGAEGLEALLQQVEALTEQEARQFVSGGMHQ